MHLCSYLRSKNIKECGSDHVTDMRSMTISVETQTPPYFQYGRTGWFFETGVIAEATSINYTVYDIATILFLYYIFVMLSSVVFVIFLTATYQIQPIILFHF